MFAVAHQSSRHPHQKDRHLQDSAQECRSAKLQRPTGHINSGVAGMI
ncbi:MULTISPECIES: hypothetical protein [Kamptonema]|nr:MULTISPECIES: hypothetical protein [Kamptonema]